jgi:predicted N-acyltransferase
LVQQAEAAPAVPGAIEVQVITSITEVNAREWDALVDANDPFLEHAFLAALEASQSVGQNAGCVPRLLLARDDGRLIGAVPLYLKTHSFGEYIFDWAWADAAQRAGIRYYPKLVAAVPYTPATGQRMLIAPNTDRASVVSTLLSGVREIARQEGVGSVQFLFCTEPEACQLGRESEMKYLPRLSMQFHWENRRERPFESFEDYLLEFRARNRKQVRKERAIASSYGLSFRTVCGAELDHGDWVALQRFYSNNVARHQGIEYLQPAFFEILRHSLSHRVVATLAYRGTQPIAGTLNFEKGTRLYGRYWGCTEELEMLHFELCYYRLIERAIERRYDRFEAGAQGEHKLKRGLVPRLTYSANWIRHPQLATAVDRFIRDESAVVRERVAEYAAHSPFRCDSSPRLD